MNRSPRWIRPLSFAVVLAVVAAFGFLARTSAPEAASDRVADLSDRPVPPWVRVYEDPAAAPDPDAAPEDQRGETAERKEPSGAVKALDYWDASRAYPNDSIPADGFGRAIDQAKALQSFSRGGPDDVVDPWQTMGPNNVGGRTLCLALHPTNPDILFAGSASGGLWKTTVGGVGAAAWDRVDTGFAVLGVSTIAIDSTNPDVMYIGTGEAYSHDSTNGGEVIRHARGSYGMGILKTTDGGATWTESLDWTYAASKGIWMIEIHPTDPSILYAATTDGVYKSTDAGGSWTQVHSVVMAMDVRIHPTSPNIVFAACGNFGSTGRGIYRTTTGGTSWSKLTSGLPTSWNGKCQLDIAPTSPNIIFASIADDDVGKGLYRSTNTGNSWSQVNSTDFPSYQGWYSHYVLVSPFDSQDLFVGGIEIYRSTNGGNSLSQKSSWQEVYFGTSPPEGPIGGDNYAHADHHFAVWHPTDPDTIFFASDGGVFKTTDFGENFESLIGGYQTSQFYNGFASAATDLDFAMGGLQDNFTVVYHGNLPWRRVIGGDGAWNAIHPWNTQTIYGAYYYLNTLRSYDGGYNWSTVTPPENSGDYTAFVAPYVLCPLSYSRLYGGRSRVYRSDNEGASWYWTNGGAPLVSGSPVLSMAVAKTDADVVYAGTAPISDRARVFATTNGSSWTEVTGILPDRYPADLAVDPNDPMHVWVTFLGFGTSHVFKSLDGGTTWIDVGSGLPDIPTSAVAIDPNSSNVVYVGTDLGAYVTADGGNNWHEFTSGMPRAMINDLKIVAGYGRIRAATHGNGAWERDLFDGCLGGGTATNYCTVSPNSVGPGAMIGSTGTTSIGTNAFTVTVIAAPPDQFGLFYYGAAQIDIPFGDGVRCVGGGGAGGIFRLSPAQMTDGAGNASRQVDFTQPPVDSGPGMIVPGDTWNFQFWYRDPTIGTGINLSDGLEVVFCP